MNEHFKNIMDEATTRLDASLKQAQDAVAKAKKDMRALADFGEQLPHAFLDKFNRVLTAELQVREEYWQETTAYIDIGGSQARFIQYGEKLTPMKGKYRVIVLLQKMD